MFKIRFALALLLCSSFAFADNKVLMSASCFGDPQLTYSSFTNQLATGVKKFDPTAFEQRFPTKKFDMRKALLDCIDFIYHVDGFNVAGYYIKPKKATDEKLPIIIFNRGGNAAYGAVNLYQKLDLLADLAQAGYLVIGSQYRGASVNSIPNNGQDEFGGSDVNDVLALMDIAEQIADADTSRVAMMGWSRGAMQTYLAAAKLPNLKAIVAVAGNADIETALAWRPTMENVYTARVPNFKANREAELKRRSVIYWLDDLPNAPILLLHGSADKRVNVEQTERLGAALKQKAHEYKLVIYQNDNHGLWKNRPKVRAEILAWLDKHI